MSLPRLDSLKIKAKLLQKAKARAGKPIALKDAFALLARYAGYNSWREWKIEMELHEKIKPPYAAALWHVWYGAYADALEHLQREEGESKTNFLMPYQKHFFICDETYIRELGLNLDDEDLLKVGSNWAYPADAKAFQRVLSKIKAPPA